jgi:hypothetical protein
MGQQHCIFNLQRREYLDPAICGDGSRFFLLGRGATLKALSLLLATSISSRRKPGLSRAGGDFAVIERQESWDDNLTIEQRLNRFEPTRPELGLDVETLSTAAATWIGRWASEPICIAGSYYEPRDLGGVEIDFWKDDPFWVDISQPVMELLRAGDWLTKGQEERLSAAQDQAALADAAE